MISKHHKVLNFEQAAVFPRIGSVAATNSNCSANLFLLREIVHHIEKTDRAFVKGRQLLSYPVAGTTFSCLARSPVLNR